MSIRPANCLAAASALALLAAPAPGPPPPVPGKSLPAGPPTRLYVYLGGISPPNYSVTLDGDALTYFARTTDPATQQPVESSRTIRPSADQWREFWKVMDEVDLWHWRPAYEDPRLLCGTTWGVEAAHDGRAIRSRGRNLYPDRETVPPPEAVPECGPHFEKYLAAVSKLIGDRPFR